ncbi:MAG: hypothetical protein ABH868_02170 [bacterium]
MSKIIEKLKGGDFRSIAKSNEVAKEIKKNPALFEEVFDAMVGDDELLRIRAADTLEKVSLRHPEYLEPFKGRLIKEASKIDQKEVRWHVAQMLSYVNLSRLEKNQVIKILLKYIDTDTSNIVKVFFMQTLAEFAMKNEGMKLQVIKKIQSTMKNASPAVLNRGKRLIKLLTKP